jgi:hypothetical protein
VTITRGRLLASAAALAAAVAVAGPAPRAQESQGAPTGTDMPSTQHQQGVVKPTPDLHGRSGGGEAEAHGNDAGSPSAAAEPNRPCETEAKEAAVAAAGKQDAPSGAAVEGCPPQ